RLNQSDISHPFLYTAMSPPLRLPHFPYATLFRSIRYGSGGNFVRDVKISRDGHPLRSSLRTNHAFVRAEPVEALPFSAPARRKRSEEHTSELQSREKLVCRLLLEKKKDHTQTWY